MNPDTTPWLEVLANYEATHRYETHRVPIGCELVHTGRALLAQLEAQLDLPCDR